MADVLSDRTQYREPENSDDSIANGLAVGEIVLMIWGKQRILMEVTSLNAEANSWEAKGVNILSVEGEIEFPIRVIDDNFPGPQDPVWTKEGADADHPLGD